MVLSYLQFARMIARNVAIGVMIVAIVIIIGAVGYKIYIDKQAQYAKECSQSILAYNRLLFNKFYCLNELISGVEAKIADAQGKVASYQTRLDNNIGTLSADTISRLQMAIICQNNYITYLEGLLNKYRTISTDRIKESVIEKCGAYYPADGSVVTDSGGVLPDCKGVLLPGIVAADLKPNIVCPLIASAS